MAVSSSPARRWMATVFDTTWDTGKCSADIKWLRGQEEVAPETGKDHFQLYFVLSRPMRMHGAKMALGSGSAHLDKCKGTHQQCLAYVTKSTSRKPGGLSFSIGEDGVAGQGSRTDHEAAVEILRDGGVKRLLDDDPVYVLKHCSKIQKFVSYEQVYRSPVQRNVQFWFVSGESGKGKTAGVLEIFSGVFQLQKTQSGYWYDGYDPTIHKVLLIDDVQPGDIKLTDLLRMCDRWVYPVPYKGGMVNALWEMVVITSNYNWDSIFYADYHGAMKRRANVICDGVINKWWYYDICHVYHLMAIQHVQAGTVQEWLNVPNVACYDNKVKVSVPAWLDSTVSDALPQALLDDTADDETTSPVLDDD